MVVRTFYWDPGARGIRKWLSRPSFRVGNAGDLLNRDLVRHLYGEEPLNVADEGQRLLLVGSVAHRATRGDVISGIGTKGSPMPSPSETGEVLIRGVRGPITEDALRDAGHDVSGILFHADPGLLVNDLYPKESSLSAVRGRVLFIPHYRDRADYRKVAGVRIMDIDCEPARLASEIAQAEYVLTSSLHALIFAHAIGRPVRLIAPLQKEPMLKYKDYIASVEVPWQDPVDLDTALSERKAESPANIKVAWKDIVFPTAAELKSAGVMR